MNRSEDKNLDKMFSLTTTKQFPTLFSEHIHWTHLVTETKTSE